MSTTLIEPVANPNSVAPSLPQGWEWTKLGAVVLSFKNGIYKPEEFYGSGTPCLRMYNIEGGSIVWRDIKLMRLTKKEEEEYGLEPGDILINRVNSWELVGKAACIPTGLGPLVFESKNIRIRLIREVAEPKFVSYFLQTDTARRQIELSLKQTVGMATVSQSNIAEWELPLPPLAEQLRIVEAIETELTRLDAGVASLKAARAKLRRYRASVLKAACEGRLVAQDPSDEPASALLGRILAERRERWAADLSARGKDPAKARYEEPVTPDAEGLPELPAGWMWASLQSLCSTLTDGDHLPPPKAETGVPFIVIGNVSRGFLDFTDTRFVLSEYYDSLDSSRKPRSGDILYTVTGSYGIPILVEKDEPFCVQRHIAILRPLNTLDRRYLWSALASSFVYVQATKRATGTAQKTVSLGVLREFAIPLPPLAEQRRIVAEVERRLSVVAAMEAAVAANLKRAERLRQAILKRAFEGRLVPQYPSDEPASVLLERIRAARQEAAASPASNGRRGRPCNDEGAAQKAPNDAPRRRGRPRKEAPQPTGRALPASEPVRGAEQLGLEGLAEQ